MTVATMQTLSGKLALRCAASLSSIESGIAVDRLRKSFGPVEILHDISFTLHDSEFLTLLGASGSGKSTTLGIIAGFIEPSSGEVRIGGRSMTGIPPRGRNLGVVFQNYALFPHLTVLQNIEFGLRMRNMPQAERRRRALVMLERLSLAGLHDRRPAQLSGGQQQRVALARALSIDPVALLLDEPLGALDRQLRQSVQLELKALQRDTGVSVLYVTHDQEEAMVLSDRIAVMRSGRILQIDPPAQLYRRPRSRFVAEFLGEANIIEVCVIDGSSDTLSIEYPDGSPGLLNRPSHMAFVPGSRSLVCLRPERISLGPAARQLSNSTRAVLADRVHVGAIVRYTLQALGSRLIAMIPDGDPLSNLTLGTEVDAGWSSGSAHLVDPD